MQRPAGTAGCWSWLTSRNYSSRPPTSSPASAPGPVFDIYSAGPEASGPTRTGRRRRRLVGLPAERAPIRAAKVTCASPRSPERGWHDPCAVGRWLPVVGISRSERQLRSRRGSATAPCPPNRDCAARGDVVSRDHGRPGADQPRPLPAAP